MLDNNLKSQLSELAKKISSMFTVTVSAEAIKEIDKFYAMGLENMELKFDMNFVGNPSNLDDFKNYVIENIKDFTASMRSRLRKEITTGLMNLEPLSKIMQRITETFDVAKQRAEAIARTESNSAYNMAHMDAARESGVELKKMISVQIDDRTSPICKRLHKKYGTEEKAINMDQNFIDNESGKRFDRPPFHVNCFLPNTKIKTQHGEKKIQDIVIGDYVYTHKNRFKKVYGVMNRKISEEIYVIETSKSKINVTGEHPIMTNTGWKKAKDLTNQDWILHTK